MRRIYNNDTGVTIWRGNEYLVDGQPAAVDPPLCLLTEVERPDPDYEATTHRLVSVAAYADIEAGEWVHRSRVAAPLTEDELDSSSRKTWVTVTDFWNEFTASEKYLIETSADPTIVVMRADLKLWPRDVWSDDPRIVGGLGHLVAAGIITEERREAILAK